MSYYKNQATIRDEELRLAGRDIQAELAFDPHIDEHEFVCDCPACITIWDRSTGPRDFITPSERVVRTPWPLAAKLFWLGYLGCIALGIGAAARYLHG